MSKEEEFEARSWKICDNNLIIPVENLHQHESENIQVVEQISESVTVSNGSISQTLLIGIDGSFFQPASKEVIFVQNADLKLSGAELRVETSENTETNKLVSPGYLISLVEPEKIHNWHNLNLRRVRKERYEITGDCFNENPSTSGLFLESSSRVEEVVEVTESVKDDEESKKYSAENSQIGEDISLKETPAINTLLVLDESLPLKKKAKMKKVSTSDSLPGSSNQAQVAIASSSADGLNKSISINPSKEEATTSVPLRKRIKRQNQKSCCYSDPELSDEETVPTFEDPASAETYKAIIDVVDDLKKRLLIDDDFGEIVMKGMSEMKVDLLEELKRDVSDHAVHSYELLAFAFLLHFRRRPAYHYMTAVFQKTWPTVEKLKEWKTLVNSTGKGSKRKKKIG